VIFWTRPHWSKIEKYIESAISPNGKRIAVAGRGDILLFLLKKEMQEIFLIVRASRIELWLGLRMVKASVGFLMKAENINWLFQINLEEQKKCNRKSNFLL
jgi:hypothetical protein